MGPLEEIRGSLWRMFLKILLSMLSTDRAGELIGDTLDPMAVVTVGHRPLKDPSRIAMNLIPFSMIKVYVHDNCVVLFKLGGEFFTGSGERIVGERIFEQDCR